MKFLLYIFILNVFCLFNEIGLLKNSRSSIISLYFRKYNVIVILKMLLKILRKYRNLIKI